MGLALEVSRRYQLDDGAGGGAGGGVWIAWGVAYLGVGDYAGARQKLGQLLRGLSDARTYTSLSTGTGKIIADVLAALERAPPPPNASSVSATEQAFTISANSCIVGSSSNKVVGELEKDVVQLVSKSQVKSSIHSTVI
jgi:hypothetical protein